MGITLTYFDYFMLDQEHLGITNLVKLNPRTFKKIDQPCQIDSHQFRSISNGLCPTNGTNRVPADSGGPRCMDKASIEEGRLRLLQANADICR